VVKNTIAERAGQRHSRRKVIDQSQRHEIRSRSPTPIRWLSRQGADKNRQGRTGISISLRDRGKAEVISIAEIQQLANLPSKDELDQQDHVPAECGRRSALPRH